LLTPPLPLPAGLSNVSLGTKVLAPEQKHFPGVVGIHGYQEMTVRLKKSQ
jgi:hypothetical protein